jgi:hypothetical protein
LIKTTLEAARPELSEDPVVPMARSEGRLAEETYQATVCGARVEDMSDGRKPMEAYMFEGSESMRQTGRIDRMDSNFAPLRAWWLGGGSGKVPEEWFRAWPTKAVFDPDDRPLTPWIGAGGYCVSEDVKGVIEELSPGVHQFIPLSVEAGPPSDRRTYEYYSLHVADRADEVLFERSEVEWYEVIATGKKIGAK